MYTRDAIERLIPHKGAMCLWSKVISWNDDAITLETDSHHSREHPLRCRDQLSCVHLCEYGAQLMAVHGGLLADRDAGKVARAGVLVALRNTRLHVPRIDDLQGVLVGQAQMLTASEHSQQYQFEIFHERMCIATGRATVMFRE